MQGKITEITPLTIKIEGAEGTVTIGRKKQTVQFMKLRSKKVGDIVEVETMQSVAGSFYTDANGQQRQATGNLFCPITLETSERDARAQRVIMEEFAFEKKLKELGL